MFFKSTLGITENKLMSKYPEYYKMIYDTIKIENISISERIWLYQNNLKDIPTCLNCNEKVEFIKFYKGYRKYCSRKCAVINTHKDVNIKNKRIKKLQECNYDPIIRKKMTIKANKTKDLFTKEENEIINNKRKKTNLEKYGVDNISKDFKVRDKISKSLINSLPKFKLKNTIIRIENMNLFTIKTIEDNDFHLNCNICKNDFIISRSLFNQRNRFDITICLACNPNNISSDFENKISNFILENYNGLVFNNYRGFKKYEIDIYLPELNIGIECNGLYWHCDIYKDKNYHKDKSKFFKDKDIKIIHIWEDDWKFKRKIVESRLKSILNLNDKIYARNCKIKEVDSITCKYFLNSNHLQLSVNSKYKIGLYLEDELVSLITFGNFRKNLGRSKEEGSYELLRFCNKLGYNVIGGASKLLNYFIKEYKPVNIISYANIDWSSGDLYNKLGFKYIRNTDPNYFYFNKDEGIRHNRFKYRKDVLIKDGYDSTETEHKIMNKRGFYRIYDSGSMLFQKNIIS